MIRLASSAFFFSFPVLFLWPSLFIWRPWVAWKQQLSSAIYPSTTTIEPLKPAQWVYLFFLLLELFSLYFLLPSIVLCVFHWPVFTQMIWCCVFLALLLQNVTAAVMLLPETTSALDLPGRVPIDQLGFLTECSCWIPLPLILPLQIELQDVELCNTILYTPAPILTMEWWQHYSGPCPQSL